MIFIGADHGGFQLKNQIADHLKSLNKEVLDIGVYNTDSVDYPDVAKELCEKVLSNPDSFGILVCGTGIGISIAANKIDGIRCALLSDPYSAKMAKEHNNANVIALGGRVLGTDLAKTIVDSYIGASFQGGRHKTRVDKIMSLEK